MDRWTKTLFIVGLALIIIGVVLLVFFEDPKDTYDLTSSESIVRTSGLPPKIYHPWRLAITILYILFVAIYCYIDKLCKKLDCEKMLIRFRRCVFVRYYSLISLSFLVMIQLFFGLLALSRIPKIQLADFIHSPILVSSGWLLVAFGFLPYFHGHVKYLRTNSLSDILSRLNSDQQSNSSDEDEGQN